MRRALDFCASLPPSPKPQYNHEKTNKPKPGSSIKILISSFQNCQHHEIKERLRKCDIERDLRKHSD